MQSLHEQYRPTAWQDVVGQDKIIRKVEAFRRRGLAGRAYWIAGQSGTGKTTIGRLIAAEVASELCTVEIDATDVAVGIAFAARKIGVAVYFQYLLVLCQRSFVLPEFVIDEA